MATRTQTPRQFAKATAQQVRSDFIQRRIAGHRGAVNAKRLADRIRSNAATAR